jgi:hypothetical protein
MPAPEIWAFFWGKTFADPAHKLAVGQIYSSLATLFTKTYGNGLWQYGVNVRGGGGLKNVYITDGDPPADVGNADFAVIMDYVLAMSHTTDAPTFWWTVGGRDPIYAIFVPASVVDRSGWGGYHFWAPTYANELIPFPASLFVRDAMPFLIIKVPDTPTANALAAPAEAQLNRPLCADINTAPAFCSDLQALDITTERTSHEFVETVTDPYPFSGWTDFDKYPVWAEGEIADICATKSAPWYPNTVVGTVAVDTYWSNDDNACVPESRPQLAILEPQNGSTVAWTAGGASVVLNATASDPVDGMISQTIEWTLDGAALAPPGTPITATRLALGAHVVQARVTDSHGQMASAQTSFTVVAKPPTATISSPANGASFGAGQKITLRGDGNDPQDHSLPDSALVWTWNGVQIGSGRTVTTSTQTVGDGTLRLTVTDSAGLQGNATIRVHITAPTGDPSITITAPADGSTFTHGFSSPITFTASAYDGNGNVLSGAHIAWRDDRDGPLGTGSPLSHTLSGGACYGTDHHVTATVMDNQGRIASDMITVTVGYIC